MRLRPRLMHDGASFTLRGAIERHRGEASDIIDRFEHLTPDDQDKLIHFLESL